MKLGAVAGEIRITADAGGGAARAADSAGARFGTAASNDYRATFFAANPELEGQVVVHHAVEQQVLTRYLGVVSEAENALSREPRGIPKEVNSDLHLSQIRREWNQSIGRTPTRLSNSCSTKLQRLTCDLALSSILR
jgi:hypothetical protein